MKTYEAKLESVTPVAFSRYYVKEFPKQEKENHEDYETRTWRNKVHSDSSGRVVIPPLAFKNALLNTAKYLGIQIPGKGKSTYTKHFAGGVLVTDGITLPITKEKLQGKWLHVPSDGVRGGSKRVLKCFPVIENWSGTLQIHVLDETITKEVLERHIIEAGNFIGIGSLRVQNNGIYGRFKLNKLTKI